MAEITIKNVYPRVALPGGEVVIACSGYSADTGLLPVVLFDDYPAQVSLASSERVIARVPDISADTGSSQIRLSSDGDSSAPFQYAVGRRIATNLHPVANPVVSGGGEVYVTYSGRRGQKTPVSIYKVTSGGAVTPFVTEIMNATGMAFDRDGELYVSSRAEGNVYRVSRSGQFEIYVEGMGIATGIAFDRDENLYVGDRSGSIFKISRDNREVFVFATLEPSIAAYHLCFGFDDHLYVSGPTTSSFDSLYRISPTGEVEKYFTGLGRPQGMAFDIDGRLHIVASYRGRRGIQRFNDDRTPELFLAGQGLVGLAFDLSGNLIVADAGSIYQVPVGTLGKPLP